MIVKLGGFAFAAVLCSGAFGIENAQAFMAPLSQDATVDANEIVPVQYMAGSNDQAGAPRDWQRHHDGPRCMTRTRKCRHYHHGYYYQNMWWNFPMIIGPTLHHRHHHWQTDWCMSHRFHHHGGDMWSNNGGQYHCNGSHY